MTRSQPEVTAVSVRDEDPRAAVYTWLEKEEHADGDVKKESV